MLPQLTAKDLQRFWSYVQKTDDCWLWTGRPRERYPRFHVQGHYHLVHRISYTVHVGPIADGLFVCHRCDTPRCIRPDHLFLGTPADNMHDRDAKGRTASGDRHYSRAHPEKLARGAHNGVRVHPEVLARGDEHWSRRQPERVRRGERNNQAKLTADQVCDIRQRYDAGAKKGHLAREFGVHPRAIDFIVRRIHWKHVT